MSSTWSPRRRYSAVAVFSKDLERVVLIHKLRPAWQAGKANFPGGKVEERDYTNLPPQDYCKSSSYGDAAHLACAVREVAEETGLILDAAALTLFCTLRFRDAEGVDGEVRFFCCVDDVDKARTMESERVFIDDVAHVLNGSAQIVSWSSRCMKEETDTIPTLPNLPWLTAMARQTLRGSSAPPFVVYEVGATP